MSDFIQAYTELAKAVEDEIAQRRADAAERRRVSELRRTAEDAAGAPGAHIVIRQRSRVLYDSERD